ncbi:ornithine carbamoyltransferase [Treponema primitia ZAS-2]|uniref:Ornithine carbamoyltransferase, catabolic n=1 Tax=Treponema primitia (strain ATCC BAA-887 / DSM 12427 / ZAS-2) TaxID=545694 RepID=F5YQS5_TREPZ|nr:ornithine carbamoyltransferase [Treponema primitia]AEF86831.1 ornithine carbamoyltransferase [Treponema primitia ZAS-2]
MDKNTLKGRSLLTWLDYSEEEIRYFLDLSKQVKEEKKRGELHQRFTGKTIALLFEKRSTRTRCAFETSIGEEGGHPVFLSTADIQLGEKESVEDTSRVLGRMFSAIQFRGFKQSTVETLAKFSGVPVYNGLTDNFHPTQVLADIMTIEENFGSSRGKKLCFVGDGRNNVARSLMVICAKLGVHFTIVTPPALMPDPALVKTCETLAAAAGSKILITADTAAVEGAHALYTDVWASMGEEAVKAERVKQLSPFQVNQDLMAKTGLKETIFLHCLPAIRGEEVTAAVIDGNQTRVWDEAENRKHTIKAIMLGTLGLA